MLEIPKGMLDELLVAADQLGLEDVVKIAEQKLRLVPYAAARAPLCQSTVALYSHKLGPTYTHLRTAHGVRFSVRVPHGGTPVWDAALEG